MAPKKELCRNFQRGSCHYGDRCKFLHPSQQQTKPNPFGFGSQSGTQFQRSNTQTQQQNPFGFGQTGSQPRVNDFGSKNSQFKPFENKWTRNAGNSTGARQADNQPSAPNHKCTDPESCKCQIIEDFEHERPLWKLTCYGHCKNGPCDIVGDVSFDELRASAYDDAKQGVSLQSIVEKERNLLNSKLFEFESLIRKPYAIPPNSSPATQSPFPVATPNASPVMMQNTATPSVSSFSQLSTSLNTGFGMRPTAPNNAFVQGNPFQASNQISNVHERKFSFGNAGPQPQGSQPPPQNTSFASSIISRTSTFGNAGSFSSQLPNQPFGSSMASSTTIFGSGGINAVQTPFSTPGISPSVNLSSNQSPMVFNGPNSTANGVLQSSASHPMNNIPRTNGAAIDSIWLKDRWNPGEIPEEAPPDEAI